MSISQAEVIVDRRQLKRRLLRWRILAVLAVLFALGALFWTGEDFKKQLRPCRPHPHRRADHRR